MDDPFGPLPPGAMNGTSPAGPGASDIIIPGLCEPPEAGAIRHNRHGTAVQRWIYRNADGQPAMLTARFERQAGGKTVLPLSYMRHGGKEGWSFGAPVSDRPLYGLDRLAAAPGLPFWWWKARRQPMRLRLCFRGVWR